MLIDVPRIVYRGLTPRSNNVPVCIFLSSAKLVKKVRVTDCSSRSFTYTVLSTQDRQANHRKLGHLNQRGFRRSQHVVKHCLISNTCYRIPVKFTRCWWAHLRRRTHSNLIYKGREFKSIWVASKLSIGRTNRKTQFVRIG